MFFLWCLTEQKTTNNYLVKFRSLRIRGLSYPNLNSICDEDFTSDDQTIASSSEENKDSFHSRYSSNPDLLQHPLGTLDIDVSSTSSSSSPPSTSSTENDNHPTQSNGNTSSLSSMHNLDEPLKIDEIDCVSYYNYYNLLLSKFFFVRNQSMERLNIEVIFKS